MLLAILTTILILLLIILDWSGGLRVIMVSLTETYVAFRGIYYVLLLLLTLFHGFV
ncbi:hypothetical protein ACS0TY_010876 [Phlomoides rotata]